MKGLPKLGLSLRGEMRLDQLSAGCELQVRGLKGLDCGGLLGPEVLFASQDGKFQPA